MTAGAWYRSLYILGRHRRRTVKALRRQLQAVALASLHSYIRRPAHLAGTARIDEWKAQLLSRRRVQI
jgi:hypothetical protein